MDSDGQRAPEKPALQPSVGDRANNGHERQLEQPRLGPAAPSKQSSLLAHQLSSKILAQALDQLGARCESSGRAGAAGQTISHSNEATATAAAFEQLLDLIASRQIGLNLRLCRPSAAAATRATTCPLCHGLGSVSERGKQTEEADGREKELGDQEEEEEARRCWRSPDVSNGSHEAQLSGQIDRLLERLTFSLSLAPNELQARQDERAGQLERPMSNWDAIEHNRPEMSSGQQRDASSSSSLLASSAALASGRPAARGPQVGAPSDFEQLLQELRSEHRKLELQIERLGSLAAERRPDQRAPELGTCQEARLTTITTARATPRPPTCDTNDKLANLELDLSSGGEGSGPKSSLADEEEQQQEQSEEEDEFRLEDIGRVAAAATRRHLHSAAPTGGPQQGQPPLSTSIQRMKRMDTLKRRKLTRGESPGAQKTAPSASGKLVESGSIRSVHSSDRGAAPSSAAAATTTTSDAGKLGTAPRPQVPARPAIQRQAREAQATAAAPGGSQAPTEAKVATSFIYQTFRNSLANLMAGGGNGDSPTGQHAAQAKANPTNKSHLELEAEQRSRQMLDGGANSKRFSLSTLGSSLTAALSSPFSSPKRSPQGAALTHTKSEATSESAAEGAHSTRQVRRGDSRSRSSSPGNGQASGRAANTSKPNNAACATVQSGRPASNCSCLRSSGSNQSLGSEVK